ncbi:MAG: HIT family protein [Eubacterium sp.]|nr:HIT family protein [Eubacterium sp.]
MDNNCAYCMEGELVAKFGIKICELENSKVYLFKEQSHKGRVIVAHKKHVGDMNELTAEERGAYFEEVAMVARALMAAFKPNKVNYGAYGDTGHHLHFHLVPKYADEYEWGGVFAMNPDRVYLSEDEYAQLIDAIKKEMDRE